MRRKTFTLYAILLDVFPDGAWGRGRQLVCLYAISQPTQRAVTGSQEDFVSWQFIRRMSCKVEVKADQNVSGTLVVHELLFPGWEDFDDSVEVVLCPESRFSRLV